MYEAQKRYNKKRYQTDIVFRRKHLDATLASQKRRRGEADGWQMSELRRIRHRCKERGLAFDITSADIAVPAVCPVLGIPITLGAAPRAPGTPSIDRIVPALGYVRGNVAVISWRANHLKNNCTSGAELRLVADYIDRS